MWRGLSSFKKEQASAVFPRSTACVHRDGRGLAQFIGIAALSILTLIAANLALATLTTLSVLPPPTTKLPTPTMARLNPPGLFHYNSLNEHNMLKIRDRQRVIVANHNNWPGRPFRPLSHRLQRFSGRSFRTGQIYVKHRGGGK